LILRRVYPGDLRACVCEKLEEVEALYVGNKHPRSMKAFAVSRNQPFGKNFDCVRWLESAVSAKLAYLLWLVGGASSGQTLFVLAKILISFLEN